MSHGSKYRYSESSLEKIDLETDGQPHASLGVFFNSPYHIFVGDIEFSDDCMFVLAYSKEQCVKILNESMEEMDTDPYERLLFNGVVHDLEEYNAVKIVS